MQEFIGKRILVVGDLILDEYVYGQVKRISPEAPVRILDASHGTIGLGGAANVALNVKTLGGVPHLIGAVADDVAGAKLLGLLETSGISTGGIIECEGETSRKVRYMDRQHLFRVDWEKQFYMDTDKALQAISMHEFDGVILADYNKGVLRDTGFIHRLMNLGKSVFVDPKFDNFFAYKGATVFKPNVFELRQAMKDGEILSDLIISLRKQLKCENILLTQGSKGVVLCNEMVYKPYPAGDACAIDPSGAGDTVIATVAMAMTAGWDVEDAVGLAVKAADIVCTKQGVQPIMRKELANRGEQIKKCSRVLS